MRRVDERKEVAVTEWHTDPQTGLRVGAALIIAILLVTGGLLAWIFTQPISILTFLAALTVLINSVIVGLLIYWIGGLVRSGYTLDRNALVITWGASEQIVPTSEIKQVVMGSDLEGRVRFRGMRWPGYWVGDGDIEGMGPVIFYATVPPDQQIFIITEGVCYGLSPEEDESFLRTLHSRLQLGPTQMVEPSSSGPAFLSWDFWGDWLAIGLLFGGLVGVLALFGLLAARFPTLPRLLPLHFDATGNPDRLGPQGMVFFVPLIGLMVWLVNGGLGGVFYRRERMASYLLWGGSVLVQVFLWAASLGILAAA
jgi:hypothetical protein